MGIPVPSSTVITLAAQTISSEYYQEFMLSDENGNILGGINPASVSVAVTGYNSTATSYQGTSFPIGGVHISDLTGTDFTEMVDGETATVRLNNRRAIMTATDGQVTTLVESLPNNYHDTVVCSGAVFTTALTNAYASFFDYNAQSNVRYIYVPLSKSGWRRATVYIRHNLINVSDSQPTVLPITLSADFGQLDDDFTIKSDTISGVVSAYASKAYTCYSFSGTSNAKEYIPELDSPLAGIIVTVAPNQSVTGNYEIYISKGA
jgi:hypothetical protein